MGVDASQDVFAIVIQIDQVQLAGADNAAKGEVRWTKHLPGRHGIKRLRFGDTLADIISDGAKVEVESNRPFALFINAALCEVFCEAYMGKPAELLFRKIGCEFIKCEACTPCRLAIAEAAEREPMERTGIPWS